MRPNFVYTLSLTRLTLVLYIVVFHKICKVTALDSRQNLVFTQYLENEWTEFNQFLNTFSLTRCTLVLNCFFCVCKLATEVWPLIHDGLCRFVAHLSRWLIGELRGYSWSGVRPSVVRPSTILKDLLLQNRLANQSQILCGASLGRGTKFCSRHLGHKTKMAAKPIYGKNPSKIFFSGTGGPIFTKLGM